MPEACSLIIGETLGLSEVHGGKKLDAVGPAVPEELATKPTEVNAASVTEDDADVEEDLPMPSRKKQRLLTRVPSRSIYVMTAKELRAECKFWGITVGGRKSVLISKLEANARGQKILPFKLAISTPCKRSRNQSINDDGNNDAQVNSDDEYDDDDVRPSQKEIKLECDDQDDDDEENRKDQSKGSRMQNDDNCCDDDDDDEVRTEGRMNPVKHDENDDDVRSSETPAAASPAAHDHALQEDTSQTVKNLQGREIAGSNSFSLKGTHIKKQLKISTFFKKYDNEFEIGDKVTPFNTSLTGTQGTPNSKSQNSNSNQPG